MSQINWVPLIGPTTLLDQAPESAAVSRPNQFQAPVSDGATAVALSATSRKFKAAEIYGYKSASNNAAPVNNAADMMIGFNDGVSTKLADIIPAGSYVLIKAPEFASLDLKDIYMLGTLNDSLFVRYN